ncbi:hypothetical protein D3C84_1177830 [compost metagenome]
MDNDLLRVIQPGIVDEPFRHAEHLLQRTAERSPYPACSFCAELGSPYLQHLQTRQIAMPVSGRFDPHDRKRWN